MNECRYCGEAKPPEQFSHSPLRCRSCEVVRVREWKKRNRLKTAAYAASPKGRIVEKRARLKRVYGLALEEHEEMKERQGNLCAICGEPESSPSGRSAKVSELAIDHCHKTGAVRGLLCRKCNTALGNLEDHLPAVIDYLGAYRAVSS